MFSNVRLKINNNPDRVRHHLIFIFLFSAFFSYAQCNTTLSKLLPESSINNDDRFGNEIAANGRYMVIAAESSDTLGILYGGAAYVYEKTAAGWAYRAMLTASDPDEYDFFGNEVAVDSSGNTIVIINRSYNKGGMYIFEKPVTGWESMSESVNIKFPEYLEFNSAMDISDDGSTIVVSNPMSNHGLLYVLQKPTLGWNSAMIPETLVTRTNGSGIWLGSDVLIDDNYIYASANNEANPAIYVYKKIGSTFSLIAKLTASLPASALAYFGASLTIHENTIAATGLAYESNVISQRYFLFKKNVEWADMNETIQFQLSDQASYRFPYPIQFTSATTLAAGVFLKENDYYSGKVIEISTTDGTWNDLLVSTLYTDQELSAPTEFGNGIVWNGKELIVASVRKYSSHMYRNAILSLKKSNGIWGSQQFVTLPRYSSSNVNFGTSIIKTSDAMFAGAPYDGTVGRGAGAVYIYEKTGTEFIKTNTIYPSPRKIRSTGGSDAAFGFSISVYGNELAVGAPSFLYASDNFGFRYGKIFLYRRSNNDWSSAILYDSLEVPKELILTGVGNAVTMNDHVLFASAYSNLNEEHLDCVVIFEKSDDKWEYKQVIKLGKPLPSAAGWPSIKFSLNGDQLAVGNYFTLDGGVFIIDKNMNSGKWEISTTISADFYSGIGASIKLLENHLFIGVPGMDYNGVYRSGAVLVYTKFPGQSWKSDMQPSSIIAAQQPVEGAFFGSSLDVVGNTLVVGAPGMFLTFDSQVRTIPGNSYIIQSEDYFWKNTTQYLNLQGDRYSSNERDHFGSFVVLDEEYFYIGARNENTETGKFSGAVYYIPTPPVIFLPPPVCQNASDYTLLAYPFNGTWSGPGVNSEGTFSPSSTGPGVFSLTYTSPNCHYEGIVQVEVKSPLVINQLSPANVIICSEGETQIQVESIHEAIYEWYYKPVGENNFVKLMYGGSDLVVNNPGDYKAIVSKECLSESPVFEVRVENFEIHVGPQPIVCSTSEMVSLIASNNSGIWQGINVSANLFNPAGLTNGYYNLTYEITTPNGCTLNLKDSIKINTIKSLLLEELSNDFCSAGTATLKVSSSENDLLYSWFYKETSEALFMPINMELDDQVAVFDQGYYQVSASNGECSNVSNSIQVGFNSDLPYTISPLENSQHVLCNKKEFPIDIQSLNGTQYTWQYKPEGSNEFLVISENTENVLLASESGDYKVFGQFGFCSFETLPITFKFTTDEVFIPNVFTPNGDNKNSILQVKTTSPISQFNVFNRYGVEIFQNKSGIWDGGESPSGVYYYYLRYEGCDQQKELKGWVNLIR